MILYIYMGSREVPAINLVAHMTMCVPATLVFVLQQDHPQTESMVLSDDPFPFFDHEQFK